MARVNLFDFSSSISNESVSNADDKDVKVNGKEDLPKQVQEDTDKVEVDKDVSAESSNTKTSEPGPADGGGDGKATYHTAEKAGTHVKMADVDPKVSHIQTGGREIDTLPNKVKAKDGLSAGDVSHSVESHDDKSDSEESELKTIDASGAEVVKAADDMVMDLETEELEVAGITDAADKGISEADSAIAKAQSLDKAAASVERYIGMLERLDRAGRVLSPELRQSISWALESIDADLFRPERIALEAFDPKSRVSMEANDLVPAGGKSTPPPKEGTIDDGEDPGDVAKGLKGKFKAIWEAGVRMFWRAVNAVVDAYHNLTSSMPQIREHLKELRGKVNVLDGGHEFKMSGVHRLMVGDEFVGDSREPIDRVAKTAQELLIAWPNLVGKIVKDWESDRPTGVWSALSGKTHAANVEKTIAAVAALMDRAFRGLTQLNPTDKDKVPSGMLDVTRLQWSGPLPGNRALYTGVNEDLDQVQSAMLKNSVRINFSAIPDMDTTAGEIDVTTPSAGDAVAIIRELEKLTHFIEDAKKGLSEIKSLGESAFGKAQSDLWGGMGEGDDVKMVSGLIMLGVVERSTESQNQFFGYLTGMIKAYVGFLTACIKAEGGGKDAIDGEATRVD